MKIYTSPHVHANRRSQYIHNNPNTHATHLSPYRHILERKCSSNLTVLSGGKISKKTK